MLHALTSESICDSLVRHETPSKQKTIQKYKNRHNQRGPPAIAYAYYVA